MAEDTALEEVDPFIGAVRIPQINLPEVTRLRDGRTYTFPFNDPFLGQFETRDVEVESPTLLRLDKLFTPGSAGPIVASTNGLAMFWRATSRERASGLNIFGSSEEPIYQSGVGPYLYLPSAGIWRVILKSFIASAAVATIGQATAFANIDPKIVGDILRGQSHGYLAEEVVIPPATVVALPTAAAMATFFQYRFFGMVLFTITNTTANPFNLSFGAPASATLGQSIGANANNVKSWTQMAGLGATVFSTAGTTVRLEVRFI